MRYNLGVDLGTTFTAAAVSDSESVRPVLLGESVTVPSVVVVADDDTLLTGDAAQLAATAHPHRTSRFHKRRLADPNPLVIDGVVRSPASLMAAQLRDVVAVTTTQRGGPPDVVVLTCPAVWGPYRREHFAEVPRLAGLRDYRIITEPVAAAMHYSVERRLGHGELIAVYDLGGGTFDATVLRAHAQGMEIVGTPEGIEHMGGIEFDAALLAFADKRMDGAITALDGREHAGTLAAVREKCREAKEILSTEPDVDLTLPLPGGPRSFKISRAEFNNLIRAHLDLTTEALHRMLASARITADDLAAVLLAGGSSHVPLVRQVVSETFGKPVHFSLHPKLAVALGAAHVARAASASGTAVTGPPPMAGRQSIPPRPAPAPATHRVANNMSAQPELPARKRKPAFIAAAVVGALLLMAAAMTMTMAKSELQGRPSSAPRESLVFLDDGRAIGPYSARIGSEENWSGQALTPDGTASLTTIRVRAADVHGKVDGRRVTWAGSGAGQFYLYRTGDRRDAVSYVDRGVLVFNVVVHTPPSTEVNLAMHCGYPCAGQVTATSLFRKLQVNQETTVKVPISCFTGKGLDPSKVDVPFLLYTTGVFDLSLMGVRWEATGADAPDVTPCARL